MAELWKEIPDYEGVYDVSNMGQVRRSPHSLKTKSIAAPGRLLKPCKVNGYWCIHLFLEGKLRRFTLARLVARAFIGQPGPTHRVRHLDGNKANNRASNLGWY